MERKNLWTVYSEEQLAELEKVSADYKTYLDNGKTENVLEVKHTFKENIVLGERT